MTTIFSVLILVLSLVLLVGLIKPSVVQQPNRKRVGLIYGGATIGLLFLAVLITPDGAATPATQAVAPAQEAATPAQAFESDLTKAVSGSKGTTNMTYRSITPEEHSLTVNVDVKDFYDKKALVRDTGRLSASLMQASYASYLAPGNVLVWFYGDTTDRYGKTENKVIMVYSIDKATYQKISWSSFNADSFCDFLQQEERIQGADSMVGCTTLANVE